MSQKSASRGTPQIRLKTDASRPTASSSLPLPSWNALTGGGRGKVVSAESPISYFRKDTATSRFGEIVNASIGSLEKSEWRRSFRFLRPFSRGKNESTASAAYRWLMTDEGPDGALEDDQSDELGAVEAEALLATPELSITDVLPRHAASNSDLMPSHKRQRTSVSHLAPQRPKKPPRPPPKQSLRKRLGLSRFAVMMLGLLLLLGLREGLRGESMDPRRTALLQVQTARWAHSPRMLLRSLQLPLPTSDQQLQPVALAELDTTAILLTYSRRSNLIVTLSHLCFYLDTIFRHIVIWNNDPGHTYTHRDFGATGCPSDRIRIFNSPDNMLFVARYMACASADTPYCYFQDDDFLVWPIRSLYAQFARDPEGPMLVSAGTAMGTTTSSDLYSWKYCFFDRRVSLHSCFAWLGGGAFVARAQVQTFLRTGLSGSLDDGEDAMPKDEVGMADNAFSTLLNQPAYVLGHSLIALAAESSKGFSDGAQGETRNQRYIARGLLRLLNNPDLGQDVRPLAEITDYRATMSPPLAPHPHAHHTRAPCASDTCLFITNVHSLPPPTQGGRLPVDAKHNFSLATWEKRGDADYGELFKWTSEHPYFAAVDDDFSSVWRSVDVIKRGDYIGLMLINELDPLADLDRVKLNLAMDDAEDVLAGGLDIEVSSDGYRWVRVPAASTTWECQSLKHRARPPPFPFPRSPLLSPLGARLRDAESTWRAKRSERIRSCSVSLAKTMSRQSRETATSLRGWRFVRAVFSGKESAAVGWAVHEMWLDDEMS